MSIKFNAKYAQGFYNEHELTGLKELVTTAHNEIHGKTCLGNEFLGWLDLPLNYDKDEFVRIKQSAEKIKNDSEVLIVIGIGGSYLGAKAAIDFLKSPLYNNLGKNTPEIYFAGNTISGTALNDIIALCEGRDFSVNIISKSGTTTEPAIAFRVLKDKLEKKYGKVGAKSRIYCTTDAKRGTLKSLADKEGYECFVIADDVGGRFSVLTAVGLLPIAVCGADIDKLMQGAADACKLYNNANLDDNECYKYAALRNVFYNKGYITEMLISYEPRITMMGEWFKQLFGESEGKDNKGLLPTSATFSTDLHSLGQYVQDGRRFIFETAITVKNHSNDYTIEAAEDDGDGLNFLAGKTMSFVNQKAFEGTILAHNDGGVPNLVLQIDAIDEYNLGFLFYFFEKACAVSAYLLAVNPYNQPGVESYKINMFALLGKPSYESKKAELEKRLNM